MTSSSEKHKRVRKKQRENADSHHHPKEKTDQVNRVLEGKSDLRILEVFAGFGGKGNLTPVYEQYGDVTGLAKETTGDSFKYIHWLIFRKEKYDVIDVDSYGYPDRLFPHILELTHDKPGKKSLLFITFPIVGVQHLNKITQEHFLAYYRNDRPTIGDIIGTFTNWGLQNWKLLKLIDMERIERIYRIVFSVERVKATDFTHTRNR